MIADLIQENQSLLIWLTSVSIVTFFGTILFVPVILIRISPDYFLKKERRPFKERNHPIVRICLLILKNILGVIFVLAGFIMLFIPGQGMLTIFIGILLLNFPGKRKLERKLIFHPNVLPVINLIRRKAGKESLIVRTEDNERIN